MSFRQKSDKEQQGNKKYAQEQHYIACMRPSKYPLPDWLQNPTLLPKKPPHRK